MSYREEMIQVAAVAVAAIQCFDNGITSINSDDILNDVSLERLKQEKKWGSQIHEPLKWLAILGEEFGEVAKDILDDNYKWKAKWRIGKKQ